MKRLYFSLIAIIAFVGFAALALADPGTTWDKQINGRARFKVLSAVRRRGCLGQRDRARLGAVAEHRHFLLDGIRQLSPGSTTTDAHSHCYQLEVGGRKGWRLPTIEELASLVDTSQRSPLRRSPPAIPLTCCRPRTGRLLATPQCRRAWAVDFAIGNVFNLAIRPDTREVWCVRGGQGIDGVQ